MLKERLKKSEACQHEEAVLIREGMAGHFAALVHNMYSL